MNNKQNIIKDLLENSPFKYKDLINKAIIFAEQKHKGEKRLSGEEFIIHPLKTAQKLSHCKCDTNTIIAGILHSCFEKDEQTKKQVTETFGSDITTIIKSVKNISKATASKDTHYEIITKYILNSNKDLRPVLIKLAGATHNVETIDYLPEDIKKGKIQKAFNVYGKIAEYLDLEDMKKHIEENAFKIYNPVEYEVITKKLHDTNIDTDLLNKYHEYFNDITKELGDDIKIKGRIKSKYSIYNKLKKYEKEWTNPRLDKISDIIGFRIITRSQETCYKILERFMDLGELDYDEFDDYISQPKPNGYKAMQGPVRFKNISDLWIEIQIATEDMHYFNTYGPASHIAYKASKSRFAKPNSKYDWVEQLHINFKKHKDLREEIQSIPIECNIFEEETFVFTPKGQIIDLDKNDTVLDFAFRVHSEIGHSTIAAKIDGKAVPLSHIPNTGDEIQIITQKGKVCHTEKALSMVNSPSTKAKIIRALHKKV